MHNFAFVSIEHSFTAKNLIFLIDSRLRFHLTFHFISHEMCTACKCVCACVFVWESVNDSEMSLRLCLRLVLFFSTSAHSARRLSIYWNNWWTHTHTHAHLPQIYCWLFGIFYSLNKLLTSFNFLKNVWLAQIPSNDPALVFRFSQFEPWRNERLWRLNYAVFNWILILQACFNDSNVLQTTQLSFEL